LNGYRRNCLQSLLALMFLMSAFSKISGSKMQVEAFKHYRLPQGVRIVVGVLVFVSAAALVVGYWESNWTAAGALILGTVGIGGTLTHIRIKDSFKQAFPIMVLGGLAIILFFIMLSDFSDFPGFN
jgi:putative oxidoreductase